ncbi:MAG: 4a-hydroxytetrahydrobiopterin dehydratase [Ignavibacteria bacterium]|nr:4a-hydroxytetrahydrobiopterin dehydratase [Ignavibacteria bacterium]MBK7444908.1 4a-hydroxytetrahydrobiopterin dehydratase [Ignavibacteria bacterium]MBK9403379.1 4a-hydroxytetrahydrobiopterin dehydratase [Ignavibacteria bacterium]
MKKLKEEQITKLLKNLAGWKYKGGSIKKTITTPGFPQTLGLATAIGVFCQQYDHHPDFMTLKYSSVEISFSTHSAGGITLKDINIAKEIDTLNF